MSSTAGRVRDLLVAAEILVQLDGGAVPRLRNGLEGPLEAAEELLHGLDGDGWVLDRGQPRSLVVERCFEDRVEVVVVLVAVAA